ncbi:MAG TPA: hypothetical protein VL049_10105 [Candidatus Dormibacteraeota bacterium]|nr:hypothetical protein [Candidatus Dormibacteraeota bacterium]
MERARVLAACAAMLLIAVPAARAAEEALRRRIEELEAQQRQVLEQLKEMKHELDAERQQRAVPAAAPAPVAAPVPVAPAAPAVAAPAAATTAEQAAAPPSPAPAGGEGSRVTEVERRQNILTEEVRKIRDFLVLPETQELKGRYGLGPSASKVYGLPGRGLSIGGYGEANFKIVTENGNGANDTFDFERFVLYTGYKFNDWIVFNSEVEVEHAGTEESVSADGGSVNLEFGTLDFLFNPAANARAGLMLVPMGFINEVHEPPFYFGNVRPPVETQIIPSTWSATGVGFFGQVIEGLEYKAYGITSLNAKGYRSLNLRDARQGGNDAIAEDWSFVGRLDYAPLAEWSMGSSMFMGDQGQNEEYGNEDIGFRQVGVFTQIYEAHTEVVSRGWWFRLLGTTALVDDAGVLSRDEQIQQATGGEPIGKVMLGIYTEAAYNVLPLLWPDSNQYFAPWFRYSWLDTTNQVAKGFSRDPAARRWFYEFGLQYKPIPQVVLKADYHIQESEGGPLPDELRLGGGFVF